VASYYQDEANVNARLQMGENMHKTSTDLLEDAENGFEGWSKSL